MDALTEDRREQGQECWRRSRRDECYRKTGQERRKEGSRLWRGNILHHVGSSLL